MDKKDLPQKDLDPPEQNSRHTRNVSQVPGIAAAL